MSNRAFIVALIKPGTPSTVVGAGIFSEPTPTTNGLVPLEVWSTAEYENYGVAMKVAGEAIAEPYFNWCGELKHDPSRGAYRDARKP